VSANRIGNTGAAALAKALRKCAQLVRLDVSSNKIGIKSAVALIKALMACVRLADLDVSCNGICDVGAAGLRNEAALRAAAALAGPRLTLKL
jgi:Ran GTPase-activating protein (RanGAP) involved in mRNA processing and transport